MCKSNLSSMCLLLTHDNYTLKLILHILIHSHFNSTWVTCQDTFLYGSMNWRSRDKNRVLWLLITTARITTNRSSSSSISSTPNLPFSSFSNPTSTKPPKVQHLTLTHHSPSTNILQSPINPRPNTPALQIQIPVFSKFTTFKGWWARHVAKLFFAATVVRAVSLSNSQKCPPLSRPDMGVVVQRPWTNWVLARGWEPEK